MVIWQLNILNICVILTFIFDTTKAGVPFSIVVGIVYLVVTAVVLERMLGFGQWRRWRPALLEGAKR